MAEKNLITIKDYAERKGITYEAVRKQVTRYKLELDGHIISDGKRQYLDEQAMAFLDEKRASNPIVVMEEGKTAEIERLKEENERMKNQLLANQQEMISIQQRLMTAIEDNNSKQLLITKNELKVADYDRMHEAWSNSNMQKMAAETEAQKMREEKEKAEQNLKNLEQSTVAMKEAFEHQLNSFDTMTPREFKRYKKQLKKQGGI